MKNVRAILARLSRELRRAEDVDVEARQILQRLHSDVENLEGPDSKDMKSLLDRAKLLESRFAVSHPVLERTARELADAIAKMGI